MGRSTAVLTVLMGLLVAGMTFSTALAGTRSSPDITDAEGDWQVDPDPGIVSGNGSNAVSDSIDITAVWWTFTSASSLEVGVEVTNLADQSTSGQDTGSLSYTVAFTFNRQALPGSPAENRSVDATIDTNLNPDHTPTCDQGDNASKDPGENTLRCIIPSSNVAPEYDGNATFFDGDAIIAGSLSSEGQTDDGVFTYTDSAEGIQDDIVVKDIQEPPAGTGDDNGTDGDDGDGGGGGDGDDGGNGESTPGFGVVASAGVMAVVAALAARRRD